MFNWNVQLWLIITTILIFSRQHLLLFLIFHLYFPLCFSSLDSSWWKFDSVEVTVYWRQLCALSQSRLHLPANTNISHHTELPHTDINLTGQRPALREPPSQPNTAAQHFTQSYTQHRSVFKGPKQSGSSFDLISWQHKYISASFLQTGYKSVSHYVYLFILFHFFGWHKRKNRTFLRNRYARLVFIKVWGTYREKHREWGTKEKTKITCILLRELKIFVCIGSVCNKPTRVVSQPFLNSWCIAYFLLM